MKILQVQREARGMSRRKLAAAADLDAATYGKVESGRMLSPAQMQRLAAALGWPQDRAQELLEDAGENDA